MIRRRALSHTAHHSDTPLILELRDCDPLEGRVLHMLEGILKKGGKEGRGGGEGGETGLQIGLSWTFLIVGRVESSPLERGNERGFTPTMK